ncbi:MAG: hypothetical protein ABI977_34465 [Acidobacteriota bacterium]
MEFQLSFPIRRRFQTTEVGILIPCSLERNGIIMDFKAKVDLGSEYCLFQREVADELEIEVEDGVPVRLGTLAGSLTAFAHTVVVNTFELEFESTVLFNPAYGTNRNILGRIGWLNNLHFGLTMDDEMIYLGPAYRQ